MLFLLRKGSLMALSFNPACSPAPKAIRWFCNISDILVNLLSSLGFVYVGALAAASDPSVALSALSLGLSFIFLCFFLVLFLGFLSFLLSFFFSF